MVDIRWALRYYKNMKANALKYREADDANKRGAFLNARTMNAVHATRWSDVQKARAIRMQHALELVYSSDVYVNYRKTKIVLKCTGEVVDKKNLAALELQWDVQGVKKDVTAQGVLYSFK